MRISNKLREQIRDAMMDSNFPQKTEDEMSEKLYIDFVEYMYEKGFIKDGWKEYKDYISVKYDLFIPTTEVGYVRVSITNAEDRTLIHAIPSNVSTVPWEETPQHLKNKVFDIIKYREERGKARRLVANVLSSYATTDKLIKDYPDIARFLPNIPFGATSLTALIDPETVKNFKSFL